MIISNAKYGGSRLLPQLNVIDDGVLKGFVIINPKWAGFTANDYMEACESVYEEGYVYPEEFQVRVDPGDFDLTGFEVARTQYFDIQMKTMLSFTESNIRFSAECLKKLPDTTHIELLIHPIHKLLVVRPSIKSSKNSLKWCVLKDITHQPTNVGGRAFLSMIFELFGWDKACKYCVRGVRKSNGLETVIVFKMDETEMYYRKKPPNNTENTTNKNVVETIHAYPLHWTAHFGDEYYRKAQIDELLALTQNKAWNTRSEGIPYNTDKLNVTSLSQLEMEIDNIIENVKKEVNDNE